MTAASRPSRTSRLPSCRSPWNQRGSPSYAGAASASSQTASTAACDTSAGSARAVQRRTHSSIDARGAPRPSVATGPSIPGTSRQARTNAPSDAAHSSGSNVAGVGVLPSTHGTTVHAKGYPWPGSPSASGAGTTTGRCGAIRGSQACSKATPSAGPGIRGIRTRSSSPSRNSWLSVPTGGSRRTGRPAHSGSWSATSRRTVSSVIVISSSCILVIARDASTGR